MGNFRYALADIGNVLKYDNRPFTSIEEMNQALITNWNSVVKQDDTIYHLGDFAFMKEHQVIDILQQLNGKKIFVFGNHDKVMFNDAIKKYFAAMVSYLEVKHNGELICMFHYPIAEHNKCHHGSFHIHRTLPW